MSQLHNKPVTDVILGSRDAIALSLLPTDSGNSKHVAYSLCCSSQLQIWLDGLLRKEQKKAHQFIQDTV